MRCAVRPDWIKQAALTIADIKPATTEGSGGPPSLILFDFSLRALVFAECEVWQRGFPRLSTSGGFAPSRPLGPLPLLTAGTLP